MASLIFAILCFIICYLIGKPAGIYFYITGIISVAIFFATTIPSKTGMLFTDRKRYQRLVKPGPDQVVELAMLKIMAAYSKDNTYKNVDEKDIDILVEDKIPFIKFYGLFNLLCYQLEHNGIAEDNTQRTYELHSKSMSKNLVLAFNKEIEKLKIRSQSSSKQ